MAVEPWRVNFPVLIEPASREEHLAYLVKWIEDVRPGVAPTRGWAIGMTRAGVLRKFTVYLHDYERAARAPIHLVQVDGVRTPAGALVDPTGKVLSEDITGGIRHPHDHATKL